MPAPGIDAAMRVAPAGPMQLTVMPILKTSRLTVMREGGDAGLGRGVVGLAEVADEAGARRGVDDAAGPDVLAGLAAARASASTAWWVGANVPLRCTLMTESQSASVMLPDRGVAGDAGVVDEDVEAAELLDGLLRPCAPAPSKSATSS